MEEIKVEKKKPVWPWILIGIILAALLIYFLFIRNNNNSETAITNTDTAQVAVNEPHENNSTVAAYVDFVKKDTSMGLDHEYSSGAVLKLTDATRAIANEVNVDLNTDLDQAKTYAEKITNDPTATNHADNIKKAADILGTALQKIQQAKFPSLNAEAEQVKNAAAAIDPKVLTLDQKDTIKNFFNKAADLLSGMNH